MFTNSGYNNEILDNGTFYNMGIFPGFGYDPSENNAATETEIVRQIPST